MTSNRFYAMLKRMAVLWEQRRLVRELKKLSDAKLQAGLSGTKDVSVVLHAIDAAEGEFYILEKDLLERMCEIDGENANDARTIMRYKRLLSTCIDDKLVKGKRIEREQSRLVRITDDKAPELLNRWYFTLKYLPELFPQPTAIVVAILIGVLSALITGILIQ